MLQYVQIVASIGTILIIGAIAAYLKKKAENLATNDDIDKLVEEVSAVTQATKEIEARISSDVWDRQKRWEMKKEVLFEAMKSLSAIEDALLSLDSVLQIEQKEDKTQNLPWAEIKHENVMKWSRASTRFDESSLFVRVVCGKDAALAFETFGAYANFLASAITAEKNWKIYADSRKELLNKHLTINIAIRKELEVDIQSGMQPTISEAKSIGM